MLVLFTPLLLLSQNIDDARKTKRVPAWPAFESAWLINGQSVTMRSARTLEFLIQHRFGTLNSDSFDLLGLYAPSNVRMSFTYYLTDRIHLGFGSTKFQMIQDLNWKILLLQQSRDGVIPVSMAYAGNTAISVRDNPDFYPEKSNRFSYYHELMIARRFSDLFSLQVSGSFAHFNMVEPGHENDNFAVAARSRFGLTPELSVLVEYEHSLTRYEKIPIDPNEPGEMKYPEPNLGFGIEYATRGHQFQLFVSNYDAIMPQRNILYNRNSFTNFDFLLGFNIIRRWNL